MIKKRIWLIWWIMKMCKMNEKKYERRQSKHSNEVWLCWWETAESEKALLKIPITKIKQIIVNDLTARQERLYLYDYLQILINTTYTQSSILSVCKQIQLKAHDTSLWALKTPAYLINTESILIKLICSLLRIQKK